MSEKRLLTREEVAYSELKSGIKGIGLGEEDWFLLTRKNGQWRFSLWNLMPYEALTSVVAVSTPEKLKTSLKAKAIRDKLKERWSNVSDILEWIAIEVRYHLTDFVSGEVEEEDEEKKVIVRVPTLITDKFIAEEVWEPPEPPKFIVRHFDKEEFSYTQEIDLREEDLRGRRIVYAPIYNQHLRKGMVIVPRKPIECTVEEAITEAMHFVFSGFDPCGRENETKLHVLSAISSWILDKEKPSLPIAGIGVFAPILAIRGPSGSGKNRLANLLRFLSYHPFFDVSTYRIPSLYRPLDQWKGALIVDEGDLKNTAETSSLIHFLNSRATGTPIGRQNPDRPSKCDAFESFGLTIITQRRHFDDYATEGRTIPLYTDVSEKQLPTLETEDMIRRGMELQDKLLYIRLKHWKDIQIEKTHWIEGISDHRLNSALLPILALARFAPWLEDFIKQIIKPIERERRKLKAQSDDGVLINALWEKIDAGLWDMHNGRYYVGGSKEVTKGLAGEEALTIIKPLTVSQLAETLKRSYKTIRKTITSLNIAPDNSPDRIRVDKHIYRPIFFDPKKLEKRLREFIIDYERGKLNKILGVTDVTDVTVPTCGAEIPTLTSLTEKGVSSPERESVTTVTSVTSIEALEKLEPPDHGVCPLCDQRKELSWYIRTPEGWGPICDSCAAKFAKEMVFKAMYELTQNKPYATTEELLSKTKLSKEVLLKTLDDFQQDGKLTQVKSDFWRLT